MQAGLISSAVAGVLGRLICSLDAWIAVADSQNWSQQWHASRSISYSVSCLRSSIVCISCAAPNETKFVQLRGLQQVLNISLRNADEGQIPLDANDLQKIAFLCCTVGGDDKCVALLKAIAKRVCEVLVQVQGDAGGLLLMDSFFAAEEWPFLRALFEEHAPAQWDILQVCADIRDWPSGQSRMYGWRRSTSRQMRGKRPKWN